MQEFIDACCSAPAFGRLERVLESLVQSPGLHARFLNSLARLEYVGVRKMLKARDADQLDLEGLQHILEEAVHATRLKKFARAIAPAGVCVDTFRSEHTLCGEAAEGYFQAVDAAALAAVDAAALAAVDAAALAAVDTAALAAVDATVPAAVAARGERVRGREGAEACYALTSSAIEIRARCLYPAYQRILKAAQNPVSVASILADEEGHLEQMAARLPERLPAWREQLGQVMRVEAEAFEALLTALEAELASSAAMGQAPAA